MTTTATPAPGKRRTIAEHLRVRWGIGAAIVVFVLAWVVAPVVLALLFKFLAPIWPLAADVLDGLSRSSINSTFALSFINALAGLGIVALFLRANRVGWSAVGWRRFNVWRAALYMAAIFAAFFVLANLALILVQLLVPAFDANQTQQTGFGGSSSSLALIALVVLPPIIEETIFRGFIFPAFAGKVGTVWAAIISSVLFGFAHLQANVSIYTFVLGLLLCFLYVKLKSIFPGMLLHMLNNYLAFLALTSMK